MKDSSSSEENQKQITGESIIELELKLFGEQAKNIESPKTSFNLQKVFMALFTTVPIRRRIKNPNGERDSSLQAAFRTESMKRMGNQNHPSSSLYPESDCLYLTLIPIPLATAYASS